MINYTKSISDNYRPESINYLVIIIFYERITNSKY